MNNDGKKYALAIAICAAVGYLLIMFDNAQWKQADADLQQQIDNIELIPGPKGPQGDIGPQGVPGDIGPQGPPKQSLPRYHRAIMHPV